MTKEQAVEKVNAIVAGQGELPKTVRLTRYESFADWHLPAADGPATEAEFAEARSATDAIAEEMTRRGVKVKAVVFNRADYHRWRGTRPDTRDLRAEWAAAPGGNKLMLALSVHHDHISWSVLSQ